MRIVFAYSLWPPVEHLGIAFVKTVSFPVEHTVEKRFHAGVIFAHFREMQNKPKFP